MKIISFLLTASLSLTPLIIAAPTGFKNLTDWKKVSPGIWSATIGEPDKEISWTSLAAEPPRMEALNVMPDRDFPFAESPIQFVQTDGRIGLSIPTAADSKIYGFGLQIDGIEKSKNVLELKADHWGHGGGKTHAPAPFFISSEGYGVFFDTARYYRVRTHISVRADAAEKPTPVDRNPVGGFKKGDQRWSSMPTARTIEADLHAAGTRVYVFSGKTTLDIVRRYNLLNGGGALPPLWGLGIWHRVPASFNAEESLAEVKAFKKNNIPLDVLGLEPGWMTASYPCTYEWQTKRFPDPPSFAGQLLKQNIRLNLWENPYVAPSAKLYKKLLPHSGSHLVWDGIVPDYYDPVAVDLLTKQHAAAHIDIGVSGYKTDEVDGFDKWLWPDHAIFPSGTPSESMRQTYGTRLQQLYYDGIFKKKNQRTYAQVRSMGGSASAHPSVLYSDSYKHSQYITGISAASLSGLLWGPEIRSAKNSRDWLVRAQTAAFSPLTQINAWSSGVKPWTFPDVTDDLRYAFELRLRLLPYLYTAFADYHLTGTPPFRAMILEEGGESTLTTTTKEGKLDSEKNPYAEATRVTRNDQYMFGPSILVAPYYEKQSAKRTVNLPTGNWYDFHTGKFAGNGNKITVEGNKTPLFVKEGAVIPMLAKTISNTREAYGAPLELRIYGKKHGKSVTVYEDDGKSFDYLKNNYRHRTISIGSGGKTSESIKGSGPSLYGPVKKVNFMLKK